MSKVNDKEMQDLLDGKIPSERWEILKRAGNGDVGVFKRVLNSGFFTPREVCYELYFSGECSKFENKENVDVVRDYIKSIIKVPSVNTNTKWSMSSVFYKKMEYFALTDQEKFLVMLDRVPAINIYKRYFENPASELEFMQIEILLHRRPKVVEGAVANLGESIENDLFIRRDLKIRKGFDDWKLFEFAGKTKGAEESFRKLLEFNVINKDCIKERYSDEQIEEFPEILKKYLSEDRWMYFENPALVYESLPEDKLMAFDYLCKHSPKVITYFKNNYQDYTYYNIAKRFEGADLSSLNPETVAFIEKAKKHVEAEIARRKTSATKRVSEPKEIKNWMSGHELKTYFKLLGNKKVESRSEYIEIAFIYADSDLTQRQFCLKYKISDEEGFSKMLDVARSEVPMLDEKLEDKGKNNQTRFINQTRTCIENVSLGKMEVGEMIEKYSGANRNLELYYDFIDRFYANPKVAKIFTHRVLTYYYKRLNECDLANLEAENIKKLMTQKEIAFMLSADEMVSMKRYGKGDIGQSFQTILNKHREGLEKAYAGYLYGRTQDRIRNRIKFYDNRFKENNAIGTIVGSVGGAEISITKEVLDNANQFIKSNNLYPSDRVYSMVFRSIAEGEIKLDETPQVKVTKKEMIEKVKSSSIKEYFDMLDNENEI